MRFKIDENLPSDCCDALRSHGHDAVTVLQEGMGGAPDADIIAICRIEERVLITLDLDFADIRMHPPEDSPGIIVFRIHPQDKRTLLASLGGTVSLLEKEPVSNSLRIVEPERVRIRSGRDD